LVLASCSSTDAPTPAGGGASAVAGAGAAGSAAGGSAGLAHAGSSSGVPAGAGGASGAGAGAAGATSGAGGAGGSGGAGPSAGAGGASGGAGGAAGSSGVAGAGAGGSAGKGGAGGSAGKGGAGGNGGNAGGAGAPAKFCDGKTLLAAPVVVSDLFQVNQVGTMLNLQLTEYAAPSVCDEAPEASAVGHCGEYKYTPIANGGTVKWQWISDPTGAPGDTYGPICMAAGMTKVMFRAKGNVGGEIVTFGASQATSVDITLTNAWAQYSISLTNVKYNSDSQGVQPGFFWTLAEATNPGKTSVRFALDDIKYVTN